MHIYIYIYIYTGLTLEEALNFFHIMRLCVSEGSYNKQGILSCAIPVVRLNHMVR